MILIDLETTGLHPTKTHKNENQTIINNIIEIYALKIDNLTLKPIEIFSSFIDNRYNQIPQKITDLTTITTEDIKGCVYFEECAKDFLDFCEGEILVAHNFRFEMKFLNAFLKNMGQAYFNEENFADTSDIPQLLKKQGDVRFKDVNKKKLKLSLLSEAIGIDFDENSTHRADYDVKLMSDILLKIKEDGFNVDELLEGKQPFSINNFKELSPVSCSMNKMKNNGKYKTIINHPGSVCMEDDAENCWFNVYFDVEEEEAQLTFIVNPVKKRFIGVTYKVNDELSNNHYFDIEKFLLNKRIF